jgi:hypothetical protein
MPPTHSFVPCALASMVVMVACEANDGSRCLETRRVVAYTEVMGDGSSAENLMDNMAGAFDGVLSWHGGEDVVQVTPSSGTTGLMVSLVHDGSDVELIEREPQNVAPGERLTCANELVVPVMLTLKTADGGLSGRWDVDAMYTIGSGALGVELRPFGPGNGGNFAASLVRPEEWDPESVEIFLQAAFDPTGVAGQLTLTATRTLSDDDKVEEGVDLVAMLATWSIARP